MKGRRRRTEGGFPLKTHISLDVSQRRGGGKKNQPAYCLCTRPVSYLRRNPTDDHILSANPLLVLHFIELPAALSARQSIPIL